MSSFFVFLPGGSGARRLPTVYACDCPKVSSLNFQAFYSIIWTLKAFSPNSAATNRKYTSECICCGVCGGFGPHWHSKVRNAPIAAPDQPSSFPAISGLTVQSMGQSGPVILRVLFSVGPNQCLWSLRSRWVHGDIQTSSPLLRQAERSDSWNSGQRRLLMATASFIPPSLFLTCVTLVLSLSFVASYKRLFVGWLTTISQLHEKLKTSILSFWDMFFFVLLTDGRLYNGSCG